MTENFKVVKNKYQRLAIISSVALGIFCGVIVACALLLAFKLSAIDFAWYYYLLIGVGVAAICFAPFYFLMRPSDKKLAIKLDGEYKLNQKVQTMVEFASEQGALVTLQREQTDKALAVAAKSLPDFKGLLKFIFIPVVAIAVGVCSIVVPAKKETVYLPPFTLSAAQRLALNNLVEDVNESEMAEGLKTTTTATITNLITTLEQTTLQSEMKKAVISSVKAVDLIISSANSYLPVYEAFKGNEYTKPFATSIVNGVAYYKNTVATVIKSLDGVKTQIEASQSVIASTLADWQKTFKNSFYNKNESGELTSIFTVAQMIEKVGNYSSSFKAGLQACTYSAEDSLIVALSAFADDMLTVDSAWGSESYLNELNTKAGNFITPAVADSLYAQTYNCLMDEFIRNRTAEIMGVKISEIGDNDLVVPNVTDSGDNGDGGTQGGGWGSGDINYGSDDMVLDPDSGELVSYGTLMARYRAKIKERISEYEQVLNKEGATAEEIAEAKYVLGELSKYVTQYLDRLSVNSEK